MHTTIRPFNAAAVAALVAGVAAGLGAAPALAADDDLPKNDLRIGLYSVGYRATAEDLSGPFTPPGINIGVKHVDTLYLAYIRHLNARWDLEFAAGIPPTTKTLGKGPATVGSVPFDGQVVATAKWLSPSLVLEYKLLDPGNAFQPFVGLGVNYTHFYDRVSTAAGDAANGGPTRIHLSDSLGPVGTAGLTYRFTRQINATASYSLVRVNSDYESNTAGVVRKTSVRFNPRIVVLSVGYSF